MKRSFLTLRLLLAGCLFMTLFCCGCRKNSFKNQISNLKELNAPSYTIGVMTGIVATREAKKHFPKADFSEYSMPIDAFTALCSRKIQAVVLDRFTLEFMALEHPELMVLPEDIAIGHISVGAAKRSTILIGNVNQFIRQYRQDGTYQAMVKRWFHTRNSQMPQLPAVSGKNPVLKVGVTANNEPLCFIQDGSLAGFDTEFSLHLGAFLDRKVEFIDLPYDALSAALQSGKIDLAIAFMDALPEREESILFSEEYVDSPITVLIHKEMYKAKAPVKFSAIQDLNHPGCTIAGQTEILATKLARKVLPHVRIQEYPGPGECYAALAVGKVQAVVYDRPALEYAELERPEFLVMPENIAVGHISVGVAKKHPELLSSVNDFIRRYRKDGTYRAMYERWVRTKNPEMPKIEESRNPQGTLVIGIDPTNPPMCSLKAGKYTGFDVEFCYRLGAVLNRKIEFKSLPFDGLIPALQSGKIDLAVACMDATPERAESIDFTDEYMDSPITLMIRKRDFCGGKYLNLSELKGKKIGTVTGSTYELLAKQYLPAYQSFSFNQLNQEVAALEGGKIDAFLTDEPVGCFLLMNRPKLTVMPQKIPCGDYGFVFAKEKKALCDAFSAELRKMKKSGMLEKLQKKWFSTDESKKIMPQTIVGGKELCLGAFIESQPFNYLRDGKIVGYEVEIAILAANQLGYKLKIVPAEMASCIEGVKTGKYDLVSGGVTITKERLESVLFSEPDYDGGISLIVLKNQAASAEQPFFETLRDAGKSLAESFDKTFIRESRWKLILQGLGTTIIITFFSVVFGSLLAFPLCLICRSRKKLLAWLGERYISLVMGTPILVILMILYYVIFAKVDINGVLVAIMAFSLDFAAYASVMLRSGIEGVPRGQTEAALALGYTPAGAFCRFVLPQAVRSILPVYRSEIISTLKSTSIVGYIAIMDLTKMGDIIRSRTYEAFFPLIAIAVIYFLTAKMLTAVLLVAECRSTPDCRRKRLQKRGVK